MAKKIRPVSKAASSEVEAPAMITWDQFVFGLSTIVALLGVANLDWGDSFKLPVSKITRNGNRAATIISSKLMITLKKVGIDGNALHNELRQLGRERWITLVGILQRAKPYDGSHSLGTDEELQEWFSPLAIRLLREIASGRITESDFIVDESPYPSKT